ncbi:ATP-dependent DNA helicase DDX11 [Zeugodacus cucurbitae]|uniref:DNA 5'-3' helicase n=1 Tax=Zeugodacus cucurbitae TaxID=28588 RepID=A0A0A1WKV7_ZEUCU|nr:ATP-dependent DNA helicase DDX11 [Zeugodacus cucurbitae]
MFSPKKSLEAPNEYEFPFTPYKIQKELMEAVYNTLTQKSIGIFESPTGTGKSLTLTCSVLKWIEDRESLERIELTERISSLDQEVKRIGSSVDVVQDWITASYEATEKKKQLATHRRFQKLLQLHDEHLKEMQKHQIEFHKECRNKHSKVLVSKTEANQQNEVTDPVDWNEHTDNSDMQNQGDEVEEEDKYRPIQIFFCSRTHSQLAQVVREVKRTPYGRRIRCVSLASRLQLCINPQVKRLANVSLINEKCLDMAPKNKDGKENVKTKCCEFRKVNLVQNLSETALFNVMDIEELVGEGESINSCPYYAAREAAKSAQLVMLTYQMLLHRQTRLQAGIDLRGAIVIVDEAHNLLDTIAHLYSCELTLQQLLLVQQQLTLYKKQFLKRFSSASLLNINQLIFIVKRLVKTLQTDTPAAERKVSPICRVLRTYELTAEGEFYNIDLFTLLQFCEKSRLAQKLQGFSEKTDFSKTTVDEQMEGSATKQLLKQIETSHKNKLKNKTVVEKIADVNNINNHTNVNSVTPIIAPFRALLTFIESLTEKAEDGRVVVTSDATSDSTNSTFKYILLNPGAHFADVIRDARSIIVAGGTMQPTRELTEQLFRSCPNRVREYFYDHVVPPDAVLPLVVAQGPTGRRLCFNYTERSTTDMLTEFGMIIQNVCSVIPAGIVCFFPSYEYLDLVYNHLQKFGILERLATKKRVFAETRAAATAGSSVQKLLNDYSAAIKTQGGGGALLFSVVGGKLSEGLNFADDLGRCVIVVGMPYPNRQSVELQERMRYLDVTLSTGAGNEYYENLCLKAVNQCIGRSVRHINDYACVLLVDERYCNSGVRAKLPQWITRSLQIPKTFGAVQAATARFFKNIKSKKFQTV